MKQYKELLQHVLDNGVWKTNRTGIRTLSVFGTYSEYDLNDGFPATTIKKLAWKSVVSELLWFLEGSTDERRLAKILYHDKNDNFIKNKTTIWTANANKQGIELGYRNDDQVKELGYIYGYQWRNFNSSGIDQIRNVLNQLKKDKDSRRIMLTAWNPCQIDLMALPPCHHTCQFIVEGDLLSCKFDMRSNDLFLGTSFNLSSYALLTHILARECGLGVGRMIHTIGDAHIYENHLTQVIEMLSREEYMLPMLEISDDFILEKVLNGQTTNEVDMFKLLDYKHHGSLSGDMAV